MAPDTPSKGNKKPRAKKSARSRKDSEVWPCYGERSGTIMFRVLGMARLMASVKHEAFTRRQYKDRIEGHLTGPFGDFIASELASLNGQEEWAAALRRGVEDAIEHELPGWLLHPVSGFEDREQAALEALHRLKAEEEHNQAVAVERLKRECGVRRVRRPPKTQAKEFFPWASIVIGQVFCYEGWWGVRVVRGKPAPAHVGDPKAAGR